MGTNQSTPILLPPTTTTNAKAAENKFESDMHKASANVKSHIPGRSPNAERDGTHLGAQAGAKIDTAIAEADKQAGRAKSNVESYAKDAKAEALKSIDKFDQKVEEGSAKAKGWFGGK